eukprot:gene823-915_t
MRDKDATATVVYTSGTTGRPKGVVLTHANILHQTFKGDLQSWKPHILIVVPRLIESVYKSIRSNLKGVRGAKGKLAALLMAITGSYVHHRSVWGDRLLGSVRPGLLTKVFWSPSHVSLRQCLRHTLRLHMCRTTVSNELHKYLIRVVPSCHRLVDGEVLPVSEPCTLYVILADLDFTEWHLFEGTERLTAWAGLLALLLWPLHRLADKIVWSKIRDSLGGRLKVLVSGGSALPSYIDSFFSLTGIHLLAGYGLTETSPVVACRTVERNVVGSVGRPIYGVSVRVVDPDTKKELPKGETGLLLAKGPSVMRGYMGDEDASLEVILADGYFNTGDLARIDVATSDIVITGRAKDIIVLSNGENVAPQPIEEAIAEESPLIEQARRNLRVTLVLLVGQDQRSLGALIVLDVNELSRAGYITPETGNKLLADIGGLTSSGLATGSALFGTVSESLNTNEELKSRILGDISKTCERFRPWERVSAVQFILEPFSVKNGLLTETLK